MSTTGRRPVAELLEAPLHLAHRPTTRGGDEGARAQASDRVNTSGGWHRSKRSTEAVAAARTNFGGRDGVDSRKDLSLDTEYVEGSKKAPRDGGFPSTHPGRTMAGLVE